jgi:uncharacterized membrane protein (UPF0127 family)
MTRRNLLALLTAALLARPGLGQAQAEPTGPQPALPKERLVIITHDGVHHEFSVEIASTPQQQMVGLMFRPQVAPDGGMLFDWGTVRSSQMWMKNTLASLDMVFIGPQGTIRRIVEHTVPQSLAVIDGGEARATLELAAGTAERLDIRVGDKVQQRLFGDAP